MKIKIKYWLSLLLIAAIFLLPSCKNHHSPDNATKIGDDQFNKIIECLNNKDREGLKKMFSQNALNGADDIDDGIDYLMGFYKGKILSTEVASRSSGSIGSQKFSEARYHYTVTTDIDKYSIFFINVLADGSDPNNVGLYMIQILYASDPGNEFDWGKKTKCSGIYRSPVIDDSENVTN